MRRDPGDPPLWSDDVVPEARCLASIREGEAVRVEQILFDAVRERCRAVGFGEGDHLMGRPGREGRCQLLAVETGAELTLDIETARFVHVVSLAADMPELSPDPVRAPRPLSVHPGEPEQTPARR